MPKKQSPISKPLSDPEKEIIVVICKTGAEQIKKRRKAGLSAYYLRDGKLIERLPDRKEIFLKEVSAKWISIDPSRREFSLT